MIRKTMPKTAKKPTRSKLVKKLDTVFSLYIRLRYADSRGMVKCFTCNKEMHYKKSQAGHFQSRRHYSPSLDCRKCTSPMQILQFIQSRNAIHLCKESWVRTSRITIFTSTETS